MLHDVVILGAGAAGLICAIESAKRNKSVLLIEKSKKIGEKIRISGGGRCNFTNINTNIKKFISNNPKFALSALNQFTPEDFIKLVNSYKIKFHEKKLGQLFCDGSSQQIIDMLLTECQKYNVKIINETAASNITKTNNVYELIINNETKIKTRSLVVATGGLSIPKIGASNFAYEIAKKFDINIIPPKAALVPFIINDSRLNSLSGITLNKVTVECNKQQFTEGLLFTHKGLSGPAILQISSYWNPGDVVTIDLLPTKNIFEFLLNKKQSTPKQKLLTIINQILPKKLSHFIVNDIDKMIAEISNKTLKKIADKINNWEIIPDTTEGYRTAEVTKGGIDTNEISSKTFEAKKTTGLYFIGEALDVTGHLGGFNFQWAWSSGFAAGTAITTNN